MITKLKIVWVLISVIFLCRIFYTHHLDPSPEISLRELITMAVISFPFGLLVLLLLNILAMVITNTFYMTVPNNYMTLVICWVFLFGAGYYQWFVVVPALIARYKTKDSQKIQRGK